MSRQLLITLTISIIYSTLLFGKKNCLISLDINAADYTGQYIKLGHYYGNNSLLVDSFKVESNGTISYSDSIHTGIYLLITPSINSYEFMIAETSELSIQLPREKDNGSLQITGNTVSEAFTKYLKQVQSIESRLDSLKILSEKSDSYAEKIAIQRISKMVRDSLDTIINEYIVAFPNTLLSHYLKSLLPVDMPAIKIPSQISNPDSFRWVKSHTYFREHYLDNVELNDNGLIYTPVLEDKIITYLTRIIEQKPLSITRAIDSLLPSIKEPEVSQYVTELLLNKYGGLKHKANEEYVYLHLIKFYYFSGNTPWASNRQIQLLNDEYNLLKPASLYQKAPEILLPDENDKPQSLYAIQADYLVIIFWDYECPHCRRALEDVRKVLQTQSEQNLEVFTVFTGKDLDVWKAFLARKIPHNWTNTHLDNKYATVRLYNISQTPSIFLLSSDKTILSKNFTASTLDSSLNKIQ